MIREMPVDEKHEWLRFQVGSAITRPFRGFGAPRATELLQSVFHLKGWGPDLNAALRMAIRAGFKDHPLPIDPPRVQSPA